MLLSYITFSRCYQFSKFHFACKIADISYMITSSLHKILTKSFSVGKQLVGVNKFYSLKVAFVCTILKHEDVVFD